MAKWTEEEIKVLKENFGVKPIRVWAHLLPNRAHTAIQKKAQYEGLYSDLRVGDYPAPRYVPDLPKATDLTFTELWEAAHAFQRMATELSTRLDPVDIYLDVNKPIGLGFIADIHIGSVSTPLDQVRARFELMREQPWLYLVSAGDTIDNFLPTRHGQGMFGTMFPPELQKELVLDLYMKMEGRWLALVQGCHEEFSHDADDFDFTKYLSSAVGAANLGFGGQINLHVGDQLYQVVVRHKYRFNSSFNYTNTCKRLREREYPNADIVCVAHHHQAVIEQMPHPDKDRIYIRPGSMKGPDRYARSLGFKDTGAHIPTVILWPDKRQMLSFLNLEEAIEVSRGWY